MTDADNVVTSPTQLSDGDDEAEDEDDDEEGDKDVRNLSAPEPSSDQDVPYGVPETEDPNNHQRFFEWQDADAEKNMQQAMTIADSEDNFPFSEDIRKLIPQHFLEEQEALSELAEQAEQEGLEKLSVEDDRQEIAVEGGEQDIAGETGGQEIAAVSGAQDIAGKSGGQEIAAEGAGQEIAVEGGGPEIVMKGSGPEIAAKVGRQDIAAENVEQEIATESGGLKIAMDGCGQEIVVEGGRPEIAVGGGGQELIAVESGGEENAVESGGQEKAVESGGQENAGASGGQELEECGHDLTVGDGGLHEEIVDNDGSRRLSGFPLEGLPSPIAHLPEEEEDEQDGHGVFLYPGAHKSRIESEHVNSVLWWTVYTLNQGVKKKLKTVSF